MMQPSFAVTAQATLVEADTAAAAARFASVRNRAFRRKTKIRVRPPIAIRLSSAAAIRRGISGLRTSTAPAAVHSSRKIAAPAQPSDSRSSDAVILVNRNRSPPTIFFIVPDSAEFSDVNKSVHGKAVEQPGAACADPMSLLAA